MSFKGKLLPFQKEICLFKANKKRVIDACETGLGKAQPLDSLVLTSEGWKPMGKVKLFDVLLHPSGEKQRVLGVFARGKRPVCRVTFTDDTSVECCYDHLWDVQTKIQKWRGNKHRVIAIREIEKELNTKSKNCRLYIPIVSEHIQFMPKGSHYLDPYLLGVFLGDGGMSVKSRCILTSADDFILEEIRRLLPQGVYLKHIGGYDYSVQKKMWLHKHVNEFLTELGKLGLLRKNSRTKFVPEVYKQNYFNVRLEILQGLMDTAGYISKDGRVDFYTTSTQLAKDVMFLVQSLGGVARLRDKISTCNGKKFPSFRVSICLPKYICPFRLPRKVERYVRVRKYLPLRGIKKIEYIGEKECRCISVSASDGLYITDNFTVTHNTVNSLATAEKLREMGLVDKCLIICLNSLKFQWEKKIKEFTNSECVVVDGSADDISELYYKALNGKLAWSKKRGAFRKPCFYVIINYEQVYKHIKKIWNLQDTFNRDRMIIIGDEITKIKNWKTKVAVRIKTLWSKWMWGLSATPVENRPDELFSITDWLNNGIFGSFYKFDKRYVVRNNFGGVSYYRNLEELADRVKPIMMKFTRDSVKDQLPKLIFKQYETTLNTSEKRLYNSIRQDLLEDLDVMVEAAHVDLSKVTTEELKEFEKELTDGIQKTGFQVLGKFMALRQVCLHPLLLKDSGGEYARKKFKEIPTSGSSKLDLLDEVTETLLREKGSKIVIFSFFTKMLEIIYHRLESKGVGIALFTGDMNNKERSKAQDRFNDDPDCRIILCSDAGGYGIDLPGGNYLCLQADQRVWFADGRKIPIKKVVNQRIRGKVFSFNVETGSLEPKKIVGWFNNGELGKCLEIKTESRYILRVTPEHKIMTLNGFIEASRLKKGDLIVCNEPILTGLQESLFYGSMLGDMHLSKNGNKMPDLREGHCCKQKAYSMWKTQILNRFICREWSHNTNWGKVYNFRTISSYQFLPLWRNTICNGRKKVTKKWLDNIDAFALAVWYMDDGSLHKRVPYITFAGLSMGEKQLLRKMLFVRFGVHSKLSKDTKHLMMLSGEDSNRFQEIVAPNIPDCMQYKLTEEFRGKYFDMLEDDIWEQRKQSVVRVISIKEWKRFGNRKFKLSKKAGRKHRRGSKYCLEVEGNHNFVANGLVVSNCNYDLPWHFGKLDQRNRIQRLSSKHKTNVIINLLVENSVEERMYELIESKRKLSNILVDGDKDYNTNSFSLNKQTLRTFLRYKGKM